MIKVLDIITEFKEDLKKQCIVLMGLPAAGKSTFINDEVQKYIPNFKGYKVTNSDIQVQAAQYNHAKHHYEWMLGYIKTEKDFQQFVKDTTYINNDGKKVTMPITWEWWQENKDKGLKNYYKTFYKSYYATYFDIRDDAKKKTSELFDLKIKRSGNILVIDTVAAVPSKIFKMLKDSKKEGFHNSIFYLEIDPNISIQRDEWRHKTQGRSVGVKVIENYAKQMTTAWKAYKQEGQKDNGIVDRVFHFVWKSQGDSPIKGSWSLKEDIKYFLKRKLKHKGE